MKKLILKTLTFFAAILFGGCLVSAAEPIIVSVKTIERPCCEEHKKIIPTTCIEIEFPKAIPRDLFSPNFLNFSVFCNRTFNPWQKLMDPCPFCNELMELIANQGKNKGGEENQFFLWSPMQGESLEGMDLIEEVYQQMVPVPLPPPGFKSEGCAFCLKTISCSSEGVTVEDVTTDKSKSANYIYIAEKFDTNNLRKFREILATLKAYLIENYPNEKIVIAGKVVNEVKDVRP